MPSSTHETTAIFFKEGYSYSFLRIYGESWLQYYDKERKIIMENKLNIIIIREKLKFVETFRIENNHEKKRI